MFPESIWGSISPTAIGCIQRLLIVKHKSRYNVDQGLRDPWLMDKQCLEDIASLEEKASEGLRPFTHLHEIFRSESVGCQTP